MWREKNVEEDDGYLVDITSGWKDPGFPITAHTYASSEDGAGKLLVVFFYEKPVEDHSITRSR